MTSSYNPKQSMTVNKIHEFIEQHNEKCFYLIGYAGTGKTYLVSNTLINLLVNDMVDHVYICAPSHQALFQIKSEVEISAVNNNFIINTGDDKPKITFMTIQKLLGFKPVIMSDNGVKVFKAKSETKYLKKIDRILIVIDECSMVSSDMTNEIVKYVNMYPVKILFMGDDMQLPPVGESKSLVFKNITRGYRFHSLLDQIMRTKSVEIVQACSIIRNWNKKDNLIKMLDIVHTNGIKNKSFRLFHKKDNIVSSKWFKNFVSHMDNNGSPIILSWRNATSNNYNSYIRRYLHKTSNLNSYLIGDRMIFNNYYISPHDNTPFYTSDIIQIVSITNEEHQLYDWTKLLIPTPKCVADKSLNAMLKKMNTINHKFVIDILEVKKKHSDTNIDNAVYRIHTISRQNLDDYNNTLKIIKDHIIHYHKTYNNSAIINKLWDIYHNNMIDKYADITYGYAITTHKSQGSTFEYVYVDVSDIYDNPNFDEMHKALYTAAARASLQLSLLI